MNESDAACIIMHVYISHTICSAVQKLHQICIPEMLQQFLQANCPAKEDHIIIYRAVASLQIVLSRIPVPYSGLHLSDSGSVQWIALYGAGIRDQTIRSKWKSTVHACSVPDDLLACTVQQPKQLTPQGTWLLLLLIVCIITIGRTISSWCAVQKWKKNHCVMALAGAGRSKLSLCSWKGKKIIGYMNHPWWYLILAIIMVGVDTGSVLQCLVKPIVFWFTFCCLFLNIHLPVNSPVSVQPNNERNSGGTSVQSTEGSCPIGAERATVKRRANDIICSISDDRLPRTVWQDLAC